MAEISYEPFDEDNEAFVDRVLDANDRLQRIKTRLEDIQPKMPGAVTMSLKSCGKESCYGCPHVAWYRWGTMPKRGARPGDKENQWVAHPVKRPAQCVSRSWRYAHCYDEAVDLVREAIELDRKRRSLLAAAANFRRASKLIRYPSVTPPGGRKTYRKRRHREIDPNDPFTWI